MTAGRSGPAPGYLDGALLVFALACAWWVASVAVPLRPADLPPFGTGIDDHEIARAPFEP